jgi:hypothetical protein
VEAAPPVLTLAEWPRIQGAQDHRSEEDLNDRRQRRSDHLRRLHHLAGIGGVL